MKLDLYTKFILTVLAVSTTTIAVNMTLPSANAQRVDRESGMMMFRICERDGPTINCADVTNDFALKVKVVN